MSTYADLRARIEDDINRTDLTTQVQKAINRAIAFYSRKRMYFNEEIATASTVANQEYYQIPTYLKEIDSLVITVNSTKYDLVRRTQQWFDSISQNTSYTGRPTDFCTYKQQIRLYPIPDAVYTLTISYQKGYADLSASADTNDFTTEAEDLIEARARWWLYSRIIKQPDNANIAKSEEMEALMQIKEETGRRLKSGTITPTYF